MFFYVILYQHINFLALLSPIKGGGRQVTNASDWKTARGDRRFGWFPLGLWRRERDSNPWTPKEVNGFRDRPNRPLWHLSVWVKSECKGTNFFGCGKKNVNLHVNSYMRI